MKPFVFISYARSDGRDKAEELKSYFDRHDVSSFVDWSNTLPIGSVIDAGLQAAMESARMFVPVFTNGYAKGRVAVQEYEYAKRIGRKPKPVVFGFANAISWLRSGKQPTWLGEKPVIVELGDTQEVKDRQLELLLREVAPSSYIIEAATAATNIPTALATVAELVKEIAPTGEQLCAVDQYRAELLRLAGNRAEARAVIASLNERLTASSPYSLLQKTLVTSALLAVDENAFEKARSNLAEATAILSRETTFESDDLERRILLAEVTREMARTYLSEALEEPPRDSCYDLEVAWALYLEALALVSPQEDRLCYAWVHENLGLLTTVYAQKSVAMANGSNGDGAPDILRLDYPFIGRYRGNSEYLFAKSDEYLRDAVRYFESVPDPAKGREGKGWARFHGAERKVAQFPANERALRDAMRDLEEAAELFAGVVTEGQGLAYERLFSIYKQLSRTAEAREYGPKAVQLIKASQKHQKLLRQIQDQLPEV